MSPPHPTDATAAADDALVVDNLVKSFGTRRAVDGLSFRVKRGQILALLGPNGAGKTTTINMCEGFAAPDSGSIRVLGLDPTAQPDKVREKVGIMLQGGGAYSGIRVKEMLDLAASYSANPISPSWLIENLGLNGLERTTYRRLSGGQQQRLSLALALVGRPELVFLDEPTAGLDAQSRLRVWDLIAALRRDGVTVVVTTHLMDEAESLADHVVIIDHGQVVASGAPAQLTRGRKNAPSDQPVAASVMLSTDTPLDLGSFHKAANLTADQVRVIRPLHYGISGTPTPALLSAIASAAENQGVLIRTLESAHRSLEDVFLDITGRELRS